MAQPAPPAGATATAPVAAPVASSKDASPAPQKASIDHFVVPAVASASGAQASTQLGPRSWAV